MQRVEQLKALCRLSIDELADCLSRTWDDFDEPRLPSDSVLVIEQKNGRLLMHSRGHQMPLADIRLHDLRAATVRRLERALENYRASA